MKLVITFQRDTGKYAIHKTGCKVAAETKKQVAIPFQGTTEEAVSWCHDDESEKVGEAVKARVKVCDCCK